MILINCAELSIAPYERSVRKKQQQESKNDTYKKRDESKSIDIYNSLKKVKREREKMKMKKVTKRERNREKERERETERDRQEEREKERECV